MHRTTLETSYIALSFADRWADQAAPSVRMRTSQAPPTILPCHMNARGRNERVPAPSLLPAVDLG
eukprot:1098938-Rhodomonas_salina.2